MALLFFPEPGFNHELDLYFLADDVLLQRTLCHIRLSLLVVGVLPLLELRGLGERDLSRRVCIGQRQLFHRRVAASTDALVEKRKLAL